MVIHPSTCSFRNAVASNLKLQEFHFGDNELETEGWRIVCKVLAAWAARNPIQGRSNRNGTSMWLKQCHNQPTKKRTNQPSNQPINQPTNQPFGLYHL
jgi:hypothetical protein